MFDWLDKLGETVAFATAHPGPFLALFLPGALLVYLVHRLADRLGRKAMADPRAGVYGRGRQVEVRHETGIGTSTAVELRYPAKFTWVALFAIVFFGGGGWLVSGSLFDDGYSVRSVLAALSYAIFPLVGLGILAVSARRIRFNGREFERRVLWVFRRRYALSGLVSWRPASNNILNGLFLEFNDGRRLNIPAAMLGYADLIVSLMAVDERFRQPALQVGLARSARAR